MSLDERRRCGANRLPPLEQQDHGTNYSGPIHKTPAPTQNNGPSNVGPLNPAQLRSVPLFNRLNKEHRDTVERFNNALSVRSHAFTAGRLALRRLTRIGKQMERLNRRLNRRFPDAAGQFQAVHAQARLAEKRARMAARRQMEVERLAGEADRRVSEMERRGSVAGEPASAVDTEARLDERPAVRRARKLTVEGGSAFSPINPSTPSYVRLRQSPSPPPRRQAQAQSNSRTTFAPESNSADATVCPMPQRHGSPVPSLPAAWSNVLVGLGMGIDGLGQDHDAINSAVKLRRKPPIHFYDHFDSPLPSPVQPGPSRPPNKKSPSSSGKKIPHVRPVKEPEKEATEAGPASQARKIPSKTSTKPPRAPTKKAPAKKTTGNKTAPKPAEVPEEGLRRSSRVKKIIERAGPVGEVGANYRGV